MGTTDGFVDRHVIEEDPEVGLVDAELLLHRRRREADLPAHHPGSGFQPRPLHHPLHGISRVDVVSADQVTDGRARAVGWRSLQAADLPRADLAASRALPLTLGAGHSPTIEGRLWPGPGVVPVNGTADHVS
jgi:hypothetical protein